MASALTRLNQFARGADGVYRKNAEQRAFDYSDGEAAEQLLHQILSDSSDLSSTSKELDAKVVDWPSEYHLSSVRANILRGFDLTGVTRILELGCGCGSITRYLGEHSDIQIDAVEGSEIRASLAALRCAGLDNVTISTANFNDLAFPPNQYDLVLFIGVTEYAGRFSKAETDQQALQDMLALARKASTAKGITLVAIENRTGLKYVMGANEDHYGVPDVGIQNYPQSTGIRTYTKREWQQQINQAGFGHHHFLYPFPDYKIPTLVLNQCFVESAENVAEKLAQIKSRDYLAPFELGNLEVKLWQAALESGTLGDYANSFLILLGQDKKRIRQLANFDFKSYADPNLVAQYEVKRPAPIAELQSLNDELRLAIRRASELQDQLDLLHGSRGWRWLTRLRSMLDAIGLRRRQ